MINYPILPESPLATRANMFLQRRASGLMDLILQEESGNSNLTAYRRILEQPSNSGNLEQEIHNLYDRVFYVADSITEDDTDIIISIGPNGLARLNDKVPAGNIPTVKEVSVSNEKGLLFSGVGFLQLITDEGLKIPLLKRDAGAPVEPNKYTLPAGRADKPPQETALEEILEEMVFFGENQEGFFQIIPHYPTGVVSKEKALILARLARYHYITSLIQKGLVSTLEVSKLLTAQQKIVPISVSGKGKRVCTQFTGGVSESVRNRQETGGYLFRQESTNTHEFLFPFQMNLQGWKDFVIGDGDGFGRETLLVDSPRLESIIYSGEGLQFLQQALIILQESQV